MADYAFLELPVNICGRFVQLPDHENKSYLMYLDDVIRCCLPLVFEGLGYDKYEAYAFKFTTTRKWKLTTTCAPVHFKRFQKG